ncbi:MAG: hypothetical protein HY879_07210 [Deltaproteobacteria bacterium]|nr:hypothetical protein [Deltaproteobacteria bacterium]
MLYIIALLLLIIALLLVILVLSNETARDLLGDLIVWLIRLAIGGAVLFAIILFGVWIFTSNPLIGEYIFKNISIENVILVLICVVLIGVVVFDQYKMRKR